MIIPSVDIRNGRAVQLVGGREQKLDGGDPLEVAERFARAGPLAVIDLDAALGTGNNRDVIQALVRRYPCRVGGGIRSVETALEWLDLGAEAVILGTAARPEILSQLPRERVMAALDAENDEVVVEGWRKGTGATIAERMAALKDHVGAFLITFVEREGRLGGTDLDRARRLIEAAGSARVTIAGGVTTADEIAALDRLGADAQVGMALYTGQLDLGEALGAVLRTDRPDSLWPTVVCDPSGVALGLVYSSQESLSAALREGQGIYQSRSRGLWAKGKSSGNTQRLLRVDVDCDRDCLRFVVEQDGAGFCHNETWNCWERNAGLGPLARTLAERAQDAPPKSYTRKLLENRELLRSKLLEEAQELAEAETHADVVWETADLMYFALVAMVRGGASLAEVERHLARRSLSVRRRSAGERGKEGDA